MSRRFWSVAGGGSVPSVFLATSYGWSASASGTENATAIRAALAAASAYGGGIVFMPAGTFALDPGAGTPINIPAKCALEGAGMGRTIITTTRNDRHFEAAGDSVRLAHFEMQGNGGGAQEAIRSFSGGASAWSYFECESVRLRSFGLYGFWIALQGTALNGARLLRCEAYNCVQGFRLQTEYTTCVDCVAKDNTTGVTMVSGNLSWVGGEVISNTTGFDVLAGGNDSHSTVSGSKVNHNSTTFAFAAIVNGFVVDGCQLFEGTHTFANTASMVRYSNCELAPTAMTFNGSSVSLLGVTWFTTYGGTINDSSGGNASHEVWTNVTDINGAPIYGGYVSKTPVNGAQTLSYAESYADTLDLLAGATGGFTTTSRRMAKKGQRQLVRNNTTQTCTFGWKTGATVTLATNTSAWIVCDGTNAVKEMSGT